MMPSYMSPHAVMGSEIRAGRDGMTASDFASLANARRTGRGRWMGYCMAHGDKNRSLSIAEGKRQPLIFKCMSCGCDSAAILEAMGLTWQDILGPRAVTPEIRKQVSSDRQLRQLECRLNACILLQGCIDPDNREYWHSIERKIEAAMDKIDPWYRFLKTPQGKALSRNFSPAYARSMMSGA